MQPSEAQLEVTYLRTSSLKPDPRNPRVHSDKQVRQIAQSIESFGFDVPLLIDDEQKVIAGHGRLLTAQARVGHCTGYSAESSNRVATRSFADRRQPLDRELLMR
jgi:hypothetical protein